MLAIIGDLHFDAPKVFDLPDKSNYLLDQQEKTLRWIFETCRNRKVKSIVFLGDIHTVKDRIPNRVKNKVLDVFSAYDVPKGIVTGNHDQDGAAIRQLNARIFREPQMWPIGNFMAAMLPYNKDLKTTEDFMIKSSRDYIIDLAFGHFFFDGYAPKSESVAVKCFDGVSFTLVGHQHAFTKITDNVFYLGAIYQEDFAERGQKKYFALVDEQGWEFIEIPQYIERRQYSITTSDELGALPFLQDVNGKQLLVKLQVPVTGISRKLLEKVQQGWKKAGHYVFTEFIAEGLTAELQSKNPLTKESRHKMMETFYSEIIREEKNPGLKYFMRQAVDKVKGRIK